MLCLLGQFRAPISPIAFSIGLLQVRWYGLVIITALIIGYLLANHLKPRFKQLKMLNLGDLVPWLVIGGILGARLYYVIFNFDYFLQRPAAALKIWEGGLAIHGAFLGALIALLIYLRKHRLNFFSVSDLLVIPLIFGQAIGRWGNFFNEEAYGSPTNLPWRLFISLDKRLPALEAYQYFHPTFLYESLWNILVFVLLLVLLYKTKKPGIILAFYLIFYSLGRFFIEAFRTDSLMLGSIKIAQLISLVFILCGITILYIQRFNKTPR